MVAPHHGRVISVRNWRRVCVFASHLHVVRAPLARLAGTVGVALLGALALVLLVDAQNVAHAAQACSTLASGQVYCLTKTDAVDPLRVGETQQFTITESLTDGALQVVDGNPLTDIVPANFNVTDVSSVRTGSATGPACTRAGNTVSCLGPRVLDRGPASSPSRSRRPPSSNRRTTATATPSTTPSSPASPTPSSARSPSRRRSCP